MFAGQLMMFSKSPAQVLKVKGDAMCCTGLISNAMDSRLILVRTDEQGGWKTS
jgi:hypothetical protein